MQRGPSRPAAPDVEAGPARSWQAVWVGAAIPAAAGPVLAAVRARPRRTTGSARTGQAKPAGTLASPATSGPSREQVPLRAEPSGHLSCCPLAAGAGAHTGKHTRVTGRARRKGFPTKPCLRSLFSLRPCSKLFQGAQDTRARMSNRASPTGGLSGVRAVSPRGEQPQACRASTFRDESPQTDGGTPLLPVPPRGLNSHSKHVLPYTDLPSLLFILKDVQMGLFSAVS